MTSYLDIEKLGTENTIVQAGLEMYESGHFTRVQSLYFMIDALVKQNQRFLKENKKLSLSQNYDPREVYETLMLSEQLKQWDYNAKSTKD